MIKGVIFDMDGVIINSPDIYFKVMKNFLKKYCLEISDRGIFNLISLSLKDELKQINEKHGLKISVEEFVQETLEKSMEISRVELKTTLGLKELLFDLKKNGVVLGLASNNTRDMIDFVFEKFDLKEFFSAVVSGDEVTNGKPDPQIYLKALQKLGLKKSECVAIEDTVVGAKSVLSAGLKCIALPSSYADKKSFGQTDLIIGSLDDLNYEKISLM